MSFWNKYTEFNVNFLHPSSLSRLHLLFVGLAWDSLFFYAASMFYKSQKNTYVVRVSYFIIIP